MGPDAPGAAREKAAHLLSSAPAGDEGLSIRRELLGSQHQFHLGKLPLPEPPSVYVPTRLSGIHLLVVTHTHALAAGELPLHHNDPFDRLLIVQARLEGMTLLTADRTFARYEVPVIWCGGR